MRVTYDDSCEVPETNYVVTVLQQRNHDHLLRHLHRSRRVQRPRHRHADHALPGRGDAEAPEPAETLSSTYRGSGDQVFVLNPNGEALDQTLYTLNLGSSSPEVYVIATAGNYHVDPQVERVHADGRRAAGRPGRASGTAAGGRRVPRRGCSG